VLERATDVVEDGRTVRVASVEGLILIKLLASRDQDWIDVKSLARLHHTSLDAEWIRNEWSEIASLDDPRMRKFDDIVAASK